MNLSRASRIAFKRSPPSLRNSAQSSSRIFSVHRRKMSLKKSSAVWFLHKVALVCSLTFNRAILYTVRVNQPQLNSFLWLTLLEAFPIPTSPARRVRNGVTPISLVRSRALWQLAPATTKLWQLWEHREWKVMPHVVKTSLVVGRLRQPAAPVLRSRIHRTACRLRTAVARDQTVTSNLKIMCYLKWQSTDNRTWAAQVSASTA